MTAEEFASRLHKPKRSNGGWVACCPAHDDKDPSLSIKDGDDGGVVLYCHAGCTFGDICRGALVDPLDLAPPLPQNGPREIAATYDYTDEDGNLLFQAVRYKHKGFAQRQPGIGWKDDGRDRMGPDWIWNLKGVRRVLYRLPEVIEAARHMRAIWIVEGEKDADALCDLGFAATCNPMGAGKWADEYEPSLEGCHSVLIVPDCDEPGRGHAHYIAKQLTQQNFVARVVDLNRDDGYDAYDFIIEHGDQAADKLRELARTTPRWTPGQAQRKPLPIQSAATFLKNVPPYDEEKDYLGSLLHGGYRVHVGGPIGHGKTSFLFEAVSAAVRGKDFLGFTGRGGLRALYVDLEMPAELLAQAVRDARLEGEPNFSLMNLPDGLRIDTRPEDAKLLEAAAEGFDIMVIDPFYKLMDQEMESKGARTINACLDGIRARHPNLCTLIGFHAQEPETKKEPLGMRSFSGFKVFQRPADISVTFQRIEGDTSRVRWVKNRSPRLRVKHDEFWTVEWERGKGFTRQEEPTLSDVDEIAEFNRLFK